MIFGPGTKELVNEWKEIHSIYAPKLIPNKKEGDIVLKYIIDKYNVEKYDNDALIKEISDCIVTNEFTSQKLPNGVLPNIVAFIIKKDKRSERLYNGQEAMWENCPIFVAIDIITGYLQVEGSCELYDEIFAFQGLDEWDINNIVRVSDYINCIKKYNVALFNSLQN